MNKIAETILSQLGGHKFVAMTGSRHFMDMGNGLRFAVAKNNAKVNRCRITLCADDTYRVVFYKQTINRKTLKPTITERAQYEGVYWDQLQDIFTGVTGLYTSLGTISAQKTK